MLTLVVGIVWGCLSWLAWAAGWAWGWAGVVWWQAVLPAAQVATHGFGVAWLWERTGRWWAERKRPA